MKSQAARRPPPPTRPWLFEFRFRPVQGRNRAIDSMVAACGPPEREHCSDFQVRTGAKSKPGGPDLTNGLRPRSSSHTHPVVHTPVIAEADIILEKTGLRLDHRARRPIANMSGQIETRNRHSFERRTLPPPKGHCPFWRPGGSRRVQSSIALRLPIGNAARRRTLSGKFQLGDE